MSSSTQHALALALTFVNVQVINRLVVFVIVVFLVALVLLVVFVFQRRQVLLRWLLWRLLLLLVSC